MVVSKRERYIGIAASVVIGVLVLDSLVFRPLMDRADQIGVDLADAQKQKGENENLLRESSKRDSEWKQLAGRGVSPDQSGAESQVLNGLEQWARNAGLSLTQVKPDRVEKTKDFSISSFRATATGGMEQVGRFLYAIETASIPVRASDVNISSKKEGTDDLSLQLTVKTIFKPADTTSDTATASREGQS